MRVLYVEAPDGFGGSLTGLLHLIHELPDRVEPVLVTSFDPAPFVDLPAGLTHRHVPVPKKTTEGGHWVRGVMRYYRKVVRPWRLAVTKLIREFQPDLIHANNALSVNWGVGWAASRSRVPSIAHQKGFEYPGRLTHGLIRWSKFDHHVATSGAIAKHLVGLGLPAERCTTIYEPVIGPAAFRRRTPRERAVPVVAMHSVLGRWKGQHIVLQAAAEALRRGRCNFTLQIAGAEPAGQTSYMDDLQRLVVHLGLQQKVSFVGHQKDVFQFLSGVDLAIHASLNPEPFGRVVAEAMLSELPTIVTMDGGPAEYVQHGVTGWHVPCGDVAAMADAIEKLVLEAELRRSMGQSAREFALREFDSRRLTTQVVDLYDRVLEDSAVGSANN